jgi:hypothetical protein
LWGGGTSYWLAAFSMVGKTESEALEVGDGERRSQLVLDSRTASQDERALALEGERRVERGYMFPTASSIQAGALARHNDCRLCIHSYPG